MVSLKLQIKINLLLSVLKFEILISISQWICIFLEIFYTYIFYLSLVVIIAKITIQIPDGVLFVNTTVVKCFWEIFNQMKGKTFCCTWSYLHLQLQENLMS